MRTPDEIKKGLACDTPHCDGCPYDVIVECGVAVQEDALAYIQQFESTYSQVSKALCGKENATLDELLRAVSQLKHALEMARGERDAINKDRIDLATRLARAEKERDAAVNDLTLVSACSACVYCGVPSGKDPCGSCHSPKYGENYFQWRGVCAENSKEGNP